MKWFFLLLVIFNAGVFTWGMKMGQASTGVADIPPIPGVKRLEFLRERQDIPVASEPAELTQTEGSNKSAADEVAEIRPLEEVAAVATLTSIETTVDPSTESTSTIQTAIQPKEVMNRSAAAVAQVFQNTAQQEEQPIPVEEPDIRVKDFSQLQCLTLGPVYKRIDADTLKTGLLESDNRPTIRTEQMSADNGYWVVVPPHDTEQAARETTQKLADAGVSDVWRFSKGKLTNAISLGLFSQKELAEARVESIQKLGFPTEIYPRKIQKTGYWVDFNTINTPAVADILIASWKKDFPGIKLEDKHCQSIVSTK